MLEQIRRVGVLSCSLSGCAIARVIALGGYDVHLCEVSHATLEAAFRNTSSFFKRQAMRGRISAAAAHAAIQHMHGSAEMHDLAACQLVIEAMPQSPEAKINTFRLLDHICPPATIFLSHLSALAVLPLATATKRPERVAGVHFIHPVHLVKIVERVRTSMVAPAIIETLVQFMTSLQREAIVVADAPGLVVNRLLIAYLLQAIRLVEAGVASQADIDKAMHLGCGYPMGPFTLMDALGLDQVCYLAERIYETSQDAAYLPPETLKRLVAAGHYGKHTGQGFYTYPDI